MVENHSELAASFRQLAQKLSGAEAQRQADEPSPGLLNRLLGRRS